ncbi:MAG: amidohydrolase [Desulfobacterales bacterium]|nr:amidohydrolase [Desulfobacterales bacterium]
MKHYALALLVAMGFFVGCSALQPTASSGVDTLYVNGHIYTGEAGTPWASAVGVKDGRFVYVGNAQGAKALEGKAAQVVDLKGQTVVPGLYDSHIHPIAAGEDKLFKCNFSQEASLEEILKTVSVYAKKAEPGSWVVGGRWSPSILPKINKEILDKVSHGHPVVLSDFSNHTLWVNSLAIEAAGITEADAKAHGDLVQRDAHGEMTGVFLEAATELISSKVPGRTKKERDQALAYALKTLNGFGVIGVKDSYAGEAELATYSRRDAKGLLTARVAAALSWDKGPEGETFAERKERIKRIRKIKSSHVRTDFAKISIDGIPPTKTAAMIDPYHPESEGHRGMFTMSEEDFIRDVIWLDAQGLSVKVHAVGDRGARLCLNAFEAAQVKNGSRAQRHEVAHACILAPEDVARFGELNVTPDLSPVLWYPGPLFDGMIALLGEERTKNYCPVVDFLKSGAHPTLGTDWPVSATVNPWVAIEALVTRENPYGKVPGKTAAPAQKISLEEALSLATINGARAQGLEKESGSIAVGKTADFVVLNQNIFEILPQKIGDTQVLTTVFEGQVVFER